jgi:Protein of unknown function (DUF3048) N-terminal domain/Protein of unknown function (DUF3048) C-terminal domain
MPDDLTPNEPDLPSPVEASGSPTPSTPPAVLSRKELRQQAASAKSKGGRAWWYLLGGVGALLIGALVTLFVTSSTKPTSAKAPVAVATVPPPAGPTCPLTGAPAPGGVVPPRPALGIKIGNYTDDRPSSGLNQADIVFEEPVEGAITRLVAVYQCQSPKLVGDIRSAREPDAGIMSQLSNPLFAHVGDINPVASLMKSSALIDKDLRVVSDSTLIHQSGRGGPPYDTFAATSSLWSLDAPDTTPPAPIFAYRPNPPVGSGPGSGLSVHIPFSSTSDVTWTYSAAGSDYLRSYAGIPDKLLDGSQTAASNVVVMTVRTSIGSWAENNLPGGNEVLVTAIGSGPVVVMRNGVAITGTWNRSSLAQSATLTATDGTPITLQPGNSWEELVPTGVTISVSPGASASTTTSAPGSAVPATN